jgi:nucleolar protein 56
MRLIIGEYKDGKLQKGFHDSGSPLTKEQLQELKGRFTEEYREANFNLTQTQLKAAATPDQDIIQAIHSFEQLDVTLNSLGKYTTEWYELHHPEENSSWEELAGVPLEQPGLADFNMAVGTLMHSRDQLKLHIEQMMQEHLPNTAAVAGDIVGAKLLAAAGSLERLAMLPATTVQLLGAEQALFRHLRNKRSLPPKYGILFNHPFVQSVAYENRGKMARTLANTISIAAKVDFFKGESVSERLKKKVEAQRNELTRS